MKENETILKFNSHDSEVEYLVLGLTIHGNIDLLHEITIRDLKNEKSEQLKIYLTKKQFKDLLNTERIEYIPNYFFIISENKIEKKKEEIIQVSFDVHGNDVNLYGPDKNDKFCMNINDSIPEGMDLFFTKEQAKEIAMFFLKHLIDLKTKNNLK